MRRSVAALLLVAVALLIAGCGGAEEASPTPETVVGTVPTETQEGGEELPAAKLEGNPEAGKQIFAQSGCGGCHTLADAGSNGSVGPNLDDAKPPFELAVERVTKGQGAMPAFGDQLEPQQIADVAQYVADATAG